MAIKWYLRADDASWESFWYDKTIENQVNEVENEYPKILDAILNNSNLNSVILEAGCGLGKFLFYLKKKKYKNLIGVDLVDYPLEMIRNRDPNICTKKGGVESLPLEDEIIDLYLSMGVIEHFEEGPEKPLNEAYRTLRKNGVIIIAVPYQNLYRSTIRRFFTLPILKILKPSFRNKNRVFYQYYYSKRNLIKLITTANFSITDWFYYDHFHTKNIRVGLALEFPFLKKKNGNSYELNRLGILIAFLSEMLSYGIFSSSIAFVAKKPN